MFWRNSSNFTRRCKLDKYQALDLTGQGRPVQQGPWGRYRKQLADQTEYRIWEPPYRRPTSAVRVLLSPGIQYQERLHVRLIGCLSGVGNKRGFAMVDQIGARSSPSLSVPGKEAYDLPLEKRQVFLAYDDQTVLSITNLLAVIYPLFNTKHACYSPQ